MGTQLVLSPLAYLHWEFLCHVGEVEVSAFGVTAPGRPLYVEELWLPHQEGGWASTEVDDWTELFDDAAPENNWKPEQIGKVWLHTHPGNSADPSATDEQTFKEKFGDCAWALMLILAKNSEAYCRLRVGGPLPIEQAVDWGVSWRRMPEYAARIAERAGAWKAEYDERVRERRYAPAQVSGGYKLITPESADWADYSHAGYYHNRGWPDGADQKKVRYSPQSKGSGRRRKRTKEERELMEDFVQVNYPGTTYAQLDNPSKQQAWKEFDEIGGADGVEAFIERHWSGGEVAGDDVLDLDDLDYEGPTGFSD